MAITLNKVQLIGRLGADPEERGGGSGPVVFSIATSESWKDKNTGEKREKTQWHNITIWAEPTKKFLMQYAHKGDLLYVEGQLEHSSYEKDGVTMYKTEVVVKPFVGGVQLQSKEGPGDRSDSSRDSRQDDRRDSGFSRSSSSRPGSGRPGQTPAFDPGGMDDDIPF